MTSSMAASISKQAYGKCQLNFFEFKPSIVNAHATQKIKWHAVCKDPSILLLPAIHLNLTYYAQNLAHSKTTLLTLCRGWYLNSSIGTHDILIVLVCYIESFRVT